MDNQKKIYVTLRYASHFVFRLYLLLAFSPAIQSHDHVLLANASNLATDSHLDGDYELAQLARERNEPTTSSRSAAITGPPNLVGQWGPVVQWSFAFASAASLPDGRIVAWGGNKPTSFSGGNFTHSAV